MDDLTADLSDPIIVEDAAMKVRKVICKDCGHEDRVEIFSREEANRKNIQTGSVTCPKCGSRNVIVRD